MWEENIRSIKFLIFIHELGFCANVKHISSWWHLSLLPSFYGINLPPTNINKGIISKKFREGPSKLKSLEFWPLFEVAVVTSLQKFRVLFKAPKIGFYVIIVHFLFLFRLCMEIGPSLISER